MHDTPMDPEKTAPFELGSGEDACLLLHGFTGSPWDLRPLGEALAHRGYFVKAIRLPGHGLTPRHLVGITARHWEEAAFEALESLARHRRVFVAGLSVGALLSVRLGAERPDRVAGLALMAPAVSFRGPDARLLHRLRFLPLVERVDHWVKKTGTDIQDARSLAEAPLLAAFPLARLRDVWTLQERALRSAPRITCPTLVASATQDHVVEPAGALRLAERLTRAQKVRCIEVPLGFHIMPRDHGAHVLLAEVGDFFDRIAHGPR